MAIKGVVHICRFDSTEHIVGKRRTYAAVKAAVLAAGRFSCFEASSTDKNAAMFTGICRDPELETFDLGYPWTGVRLKAVAKAREADAGGSDSLVNDGETTPHD